MWRLDRVGESRVEYREMEVGTLPCGISPVEAKLLLTFLNAFKSFLGSYSALSLEAGSFGSWCELTCGQSLEGGEGLSPVALLDTNVDVFTGSERLCSGPLNRVHFLCKGI